MITNLIINLYCRSANSTLVQQIRKQKGIYKYTLSFPCLSDRLSIKFHVKMNSSNDEDFDQLSLLRCEILNLNEVLKTVYEDVKQSQAENTQLKHQISSLNNLIIEKEEVIIKQDEVINKLINKKERDRRGEKCITYFSPNIFKVLKNEVAQLPDNVLFQNNPITKKYRYPTCRNDPRPTGNRLSTHKTKNKNKTV